MKKIFLALIALVVFQTNVEAGCGINIYVKNTGSSRLEFFNHNYNTTGVKIKGGKWKSLKKGFWNSQSDTFIELVAGEDIGDLYSADFGCAKKRRYRVRYVCRSGNNNGSAFVKYYPSATGWTTNQTLTINLDQCK